LWAGQDVDNRWSGEARISCQFQRNWVVNSLENPHYLWRSKFGGMSVLDAKRPKELEDQKTHINAQQRHMLGMLALQLSHLPRLWLRLESRQICQMGTNCAQRQDLILVSANTSNLDQTIFVLCHRYQG
jgi:hypothetical protein